MVRARALALEGGEGRCPFSTGRHTAACAPVATRHTWWCGPPIGLVIDRHSGEGGLVLVAEAQDGGMNPTPAYTIAAVNSLPTAQPPRAPSDPPPSPASLPWRLRTAPLCPSPHASPGGFPSGGGGGANAALPGFWPPTGGQPTACTLAFWWLKFGPAEGFVGGGWEVFGGAASCTLSPFLPRSLPRAPSVICCVCSSCIPTASLRNEPLATQRQCQNSRSEIYVPPLSLRKHSRRPTGLCWP